MDKMNQQNVERKLERSRKSIWKIDKQMLPYKVHYFLFMGAMGAIMPYHPSIGITRFGLGAANFAVIYTTQQFLFIVLKPLICYFADYFNNLKGLIVSLTIVNGILSYLLLAIPVVSDDSFSGHKMDSQLQKEQAHVIFCKLCSVSSELNAITEHLPITSVEFQDEIFCAEKNDTFESFAGYCPVNLNSSASFNIKLSVEIHTCYISKSKLKQLKRFDLKPLSNSTTLIFIKLFHNWISPELIIVCPDNEYLFEFQSQNLTQNETFCFKYPLDKITAKKYSRFSNRTVCNETVINKEAENTEYNSFKMYQFWLFTLLILTSNTCIGTIFTLSDTACYETLEKTGADFGKQRAWGAIGWGLISPFSGYLNDHTGNYWTAMILMSVLCAFQIWNLRKINLIKPQYSQTILKDVKTVLSSIEFIAFSIGIFFNGMGIGIIFHFLAWFITDIGGSRLLIGLAHFVQCFLAEMPFMILSGWLIKKFGHFNVVSMALLGQGVRFLGYSSVKDPWMILPIEILEGITFSTFYAAITSFGKKNAKPGTEATTQSLLSSTYDGLGAGMGCLIGGACFDYFGGYTTFFYGGLIFLGAFVVNATSTVLLHFRKSSEENSDDSRY